MNKLGDLYTDFSRIDLDMRGGYARVADVISHQDINHPVPIHRAFKLLRDEIDIQKGFSRFQEEQNLLVSIHRDENAPKPITKISDSGFVPVEVAKAMHKNIEPELDLPIYSTGLETAGFRKQKEELKKDKSKKWLPYLVIELAPYDDSLLRQIHHQPKDDPLGQYRLPAGEVVMMALQLLQVMEYLRNKHGRVYMDWKPEHIFWNGLKRQTKLIDWNVTLSCDEGPGHKQNTCDDLRLFCGAVLYISLSFVDPDDPKKPIGPRPTDEIDNPVQEIRRRYWTDNPNFYQRGKTLDEKIKQIIQKGLNPKKGFESPAELREVLLNYAKQELGVSKKELLSNPVPESYYYSALVKVHEARNQFFEAQQDLLRVVENQGANPEFTWLYETIKRALVIFPGS